MPITSQDLDTAHRIVARAARRWNQLPATDAGMQERDRRQARWERLAAEYQRLIRAATDDVLLEHGEPLATAELRRRDAMIV